MQKTRNNFKWVFCTALPKISIFLLSLPFVILMRVIRPVIWVRLIPIRDRIGHGLADIDIYLLKRRAGLYPFKGLDIFYPDRPWKCNRQMIKMWQRLIPLYDLVFWIVWAHWGNPVMEGHNYYPVHGYRDIHGLSNDVPPSVSFTAKEEDRGAALLRAMGIAPGSPIVCFHARDNVFLNVHTPGKNWEYHDFRDVDIDTYVPAIKELVARGYYPIRMGKVVNKAFSWKDSHVIDYAVSPWRSDFADMYLISRCHFYIGTSCGMDAVAEFFRKPRIILNMISIIDISFWSLNYFCIFKKLWLIKDKRFLTFREQINSEVGGIMEAAQFKEHGLEIVDNTPEEILDAVIEREERSRGCWQTNDEYEDLQRRFWGLYIPGEHYRVLKARVGSKFLMQNKGLLD
jgi:putative glycosyltransferase (TIGR04372 family)